jgi:hypothetical protein
VTTLGSIGITAAADSKPPRIDIRTNYSPTGDEIAPDIQVIGDINAPVRMAQGEIYIENTAGSVLFQLIPDTYTAASAIAYDVEIKAARDFVQGYVDGFYHIGGHPAGVWSTIGNTSEALHCDISRFALCGYL